MILLDTNVLARSAQPGHSQYESAISAVDTLRLHNETLCLVPQVLYEYWAVATRPVEQNGLGMTAIEAAADLVAVVQRFHLHRDERAIFDGWQKLVLQYQVLGRECTRCTASCGHGATRYFAHSDLQHIRFQSVLTNSDS